MADKYANFDDLAAHEIAGVDYRVITKPRTSSLVSHIAIHGGKIEGMTSNMAIAVCNATGQWGYAFEGIQATNNFDDLHITSTHFDEPNALDIQDSVYYTVSYHGAAGTAGVKEIFMGGADIVKRDLIKNALISAGFTVSTASNELNGDSLANITQKNRRHAGVQLEFSKAERESWLVSGDTDDCILDTIVYTERFTLLRDTVASVTQAWDSLQIQTVNYGMNLAKPEDSMADFETWINTNYDKITGVPAPTSVTGALPQSGSYSIGDRVYRTDDKSIYILVCQDTNWGWYWRPVHAAISPWLNVPSTAMNLSPWAVNASPLKPLQIALDNRGMCYWRGVIGVTSGTIPKNSSVQPFRTIPFGIRPRQTNTHMLGHQTLSVASGDKWEGGRIYIPADDDALISVRVFGGSVSSFTNLLFLDGVVSYSIGAGVWTSA